MILAFTPNGKHDYLAHTVVEGMYATGIDLRCTGKSNGEKVHITPEEIYRHQHDADFILVIHYKGCNDYSFLDKIEDWSKVIFIDGSEWSFNYLPPFSFEGLYNSTLLEKVGYYFKRECYSYHQQKGILPLPFGSVKSDFANVDLEKDIDILCAFGQPKSFVSKEDKTQWRQVAMQAVNELGEEGYRVITSKVPNYLHHINRAWLTVDAFGGGECNQRTFQIPANKSVGLYKRFGIKLPNYEEGRDYLAWDTKEELKEKAKKYLANKEKLSYITNQAYENTLQYHTAKARAQYILDIVYGD